MKVLHVGTSNKFTAPLFRFMAAHGIAAGHQMLSRREDVPWPENLTAYYVRKRGLGWLIAFIRMAREADKIVLHGLFNQKTILLLFLWPSLLPKCHWVIWGGDLYRYQSRKRRLGWRFAELYRRPVIRNMGHLLTYVEGDVELAREWYGARGRYHECLMYPSNVYRDTPAISISREGALVNVQIGNSADEGNHHLEAFSLIKSRKALDVQVHVPLAYGGKGRYVQRVLEAGRELFGERFSPITSFMPIDEYLCFLGSIDIAVFNHRRQQAMGNILALLAREKKVYLRSEVTSMQMLEKLGIKIYRTEEFNLDPIPADIAKLNGRIVKEYFSEETLLSQMRVIFS